METASRPPGTHLPSPSRTPPARSCWRRSDELGGKDPFIVCADVAGEIEIAARGGAWAVFLNAGQVCTSDWWYPYG